MIQASIMRGSFSYYSNWSDVHEAILSSYRELDDSHELSFTITSNGGWLRMTDIPHHIFDATFEDFEALRLYFLSFSDSKGPR